METSPDTITIYTDGACLGNPGPGGYAAVILGGDRRKEIAGGFRLTTNNRMEILAAVEGLRALTRPCRVTLYTDSQYVANGITLGWAQRWRSKGWMKDRNTKALNPDLWEALLEQCARHRVEFRWVRGHSGNVENERCDALCRQAAKGKELPPDLVYEASAAKAARA